MVSTGLLLIISLHGGPLTHNSHDWHSTCSACACGLAIRVKVQAHMTSWQTFICFMSEWNAKPLNCPYYHTWNCLHPKLVTYKSSHAECVPPTHPSWQWISSYNEQADKDHPQFVTPALAAPVAPLHAACCWERDVCKSHHVNKPE